MNRPRVHLRSAFIPPLSILLKKVTQKRNRLTGEHAPDIVFLRDRAKLNLWQTSYR